MSLYVVFVWEHSGLQGQYPLVYVREVEIVPFTIGICDDDEGQIAGLRETLGKWVLDKPFALAIDEYTSAEGFLFSYPDKPCNLLLLDIEMKELNGMELAKKLRAEGDMLPIVFITGYSEYMNEGYEVEALHYLLKPLDEKKLSAVLDRYLKRYTPEREILLPCEEGMLRICPDEVIYCEAEGKKTRLYPVDREGILCSLGIGECKKMLTEDFISCHRSYIVNLRYICSIGRTELRLDVGKEIPLSRRLYKEVNEKFIEFYGK